MTHHFETSAYSRRGFLVGTGTAAIAVAFGANGMSAALAAGPQPVSPRPSIGLDQAGNDQPALAQISPRASNCRPRSASKLGTG